MASIERTAYPVFPPQYDQKTLDRDFKFSQDEVDWLRRNARPATARLSLGLLLKSFQHLRYFPEFEEIPPGLYDHVRQSLGIGLRIWPKHDARNTILRQKKAVLEFLGVSRYYGKKAQAVAEKLAVEAAEIKDFRVDIINFVVDGLVRSKFELPAFSTVDEIAEIAHNQVETRVIETIIERTTPELRKKILGLLVVDFNKHVSDFNDLKKSAGKATRNHLDKLVEHLRWLEEFGSFEDLFEGVVPSKVRYFGMIARQHDAAALKDYPEDKRIVCVLALIQQMQVRARDQLGEMFLRRMATIRKRAKEQLETIHVRQRSQTEGLVVTLGGVLDIFTAEPNDTKAGRTARKYLGSAKRVDQMRANVAEVTAHSGSNYLPLLWEHFISHRAVLFRLIDLLKIEATSQDVALLKAVEVIKENRKSTGEWLDDNIDLSFISDRWRALVRQETGSGKGINRRLFEVCVFIHVADALRSGDMAIADSEEFADYRKELLPWEECKKLIPAHCARIGIPSTAKGLVAELKRQLTQVAGDLDAGFPKHGDVSIGSDGKPSVHRTEARPIPESALVLRAEVARRLPDRHILDCLENVEHWINFTRHFGPISGNEAKLKNPAARYLMTIFAMGCNLGPTQAAKHLKDNNVTAHMLGLVNRRHITVEMLEKAQRELNEIYLQLELPKMWGDGRTVAADGTQYDFFDDNLLAGYHFRYRKTGAVAYRHVTDNYIAVFRHFIGPGIWEAVYVIEGLMKAQLSVEADTVQSDTQGQSSTVFAFTYLHGVKLMPRIRNWKDLLFVRPSKLVKYDHIKTLFGKDADWDLIEQGWQELMQVEMSIATGKISSARLLRKLSSYSRRNKLYFAAQALGDVIRTIYLLKWIGSRELRQEVTANTNKMESYNGFAKWVGFGGDVIPDNDPDEQQKRLRYIDLVTSAVILQNTVDVTRVFDKLKKEGWKVTKEDQNFFSPYMGEHLMRFGKYEVRLKRPQEPWIADPQFQSAATAILKVAKRDRPTLH